MKKVNHMGRRFFLRISLYILMLITGLIIKSKLVFSKTKQHAITLKNKNSTQRLGTSNDGKSDVYFASGFSAEENMINSVNMFGGIESIVEKTDIVVLKPNAQWWNQGTTNTNTMKAFIQLILDIKEFTGEIIIAENHHMNPDNSRGWTTEQRNGEFNLNELVHYFQEKGNDNVTKYHWRDGGSNPQPRQGPAGDGGVVKSPEEGDGYVWRDDIVYETSEGRKVMMTYPIFTSRFSGKRIDLKNGILEKNRYTGQQVKLINFSCLNFHGVQTGITASIKNLMGIVDMTCGYHAPQPKAYYNMHYIGSQSSILKLSKITQYYGRRLKLPASLLHSLKNLGEFRFFHTGGALGHWMKTVKFPDLNILAAEYVGCKSRTDLSHRAHTNTVLASFDPVALDFIGAKHVLLPATKKMANNDEYVFAQDPENPESPTRKFLLECNRQGIGNLKEKNIRVHRTA